MAISGQILVDTHTGAGSASSARSASTRWSGAGSVKPGAFWRGGVAGHPLEEVNLSRLGPTGRSRSDGVFMRAVPGFAGARFGTRSVARQLARTHTGDAAEHASTWGSLGVSRRCAARHPAGRRLRSRTPSACRAGDVSPMTDRVSLRDNRDVARRPAAPVPGSDHRQRLRHSPTPSMRVTTVWPRWMNSFGVRA